MTSNSKFDPQVAEDTIVGLNGAYATVLEQYGDAVLMVNVQASEMDRQDAEITKLKQRLAVAEEQARVQKQRAADLQEQVDSLDAYCNECHTEELNAKRMQEYYRDQYQKQKEIAEGYERANNQSVFRSAPYRKLQDDYTAQAKELHTALFRAAAAENKAKERQRAIDKHPMFAHIQLVTYASDFKEGDFIGLFQPTDVGADTFNFRLGTLEKSGCRWALRCTSWSRLLESYGVKHIGETKLYPINQCGNDWFVYGTLVSYNG